MKNSLDKLLDNRQLKILLRLLELQSVTLTAEEFNLSQPYVSMVLKRLREITDDPLLIRSGSKLVPTIRANKMIKPLRSAIACIEEIVNPEAEFDPLDAESTFRIASADCMEAFFLPSLISCIREAAPNSRLKIRSITEGYDYASALETGELDAVIGNWPNPPLNMRIVHLFEDKTVCLFASDHPLVETTALSMDEYLDSEHLAPEPSPITIPGPIEGKLSALGLKRNIRVTVPEFNLVPYVIKSSTLLFTSCQRFAQHYSDLFPIRFADAPKEIGPMSFYLLWHECTQLSPSHIWLRNQIVSTAASFSQNCVQGNHTT